MPSGGLSLSSTLAVVLTISIVFLPRTLLFDFRADLAQLERLKSLPFRPSAIVLGQLLTPAVLASTILLVFLGTAAASVSDGGTRRFLAAAILMTVPYSLFHYAVENLIFLWFPWRVVPVGRMDFEFFGRMLLESAAKFTASAGCWLGASLLAVSVYAAAGRSVVLGLATCWFFILACAALATWAAAWRFRQLWN